MLIDEFESALKKQLSYYLVQLTALNLQRENTPENMIPEVWFDEYFCINNLGIKTKMLLNEIEIAKHLNINYYSAAPESPPKDFLT
jgi:hypothetical protein